MTHFLYRPHVQGLEHTTTPDILIDRLFRTADVGNGVELLNVDVNQLSTNPESQCSSSLMTIKPAYLMVAAGAGVLLGFGIELGNVENNASSAVLVSRFAWRMKHLTDHLDKLSLNVIVDSDDSTNIPLANYPAVDEILNRFGEGVEQLPRGLAICVTATGKPQQIGVPAIVELKLTDANLERQLCHRITFAEVTQDQWDKRPLPRYSIGPTSGELKHFV